MFGNVTTLEGLHVTGKYRDRGTHAPGMRPGILSGYGEDTAMTEEMLARQKEGSIFDASSSPARGKRCLFHALLIASAAYYKRRLLQAPFTGAVYLESHV